MPYASLMMLMKEHHERDPLVKQTIHEHVSFIKLQEGYPAFCYHNADKKQNKVKITSEGHEIGILDFYESLSVASKVIAAFSHTLTELSTVHRPENGFIAAAQDVVTHQFILAELKAVRAEEKGDLVEQNKNLDVV